ncbi:hypothetical protein K0A97_00820 [Patescibacteria group bacterium]|nr:hypothetical protein [Patescibacteria group bacterium]
MPEKYQDYPKTVKGGGELFRDKGVSIVRVGGKERWYKSLNGEEEFDGDSLYIRMKPEDDHLLIDGLDINDVGIFHIYGNTFRRIRIEDDPGFMIAYSKSRMLKSPNDKEFSLDLLVGNLQKNEFDKKFLVYKNLNDLVIQKLPPEVYVNDQDQKLAITQRLVYPHSMSFDQGPRSDALSWEIDLNQLGISLEKIVRKGLDPSYVENYVSSIAPHLGCDCTYSPVFPKIRKDVCVVRHLAENGSSYGYDTLYLVWEGGDNEIHTQEFATTRDNPKQPYLHIEDLSEENDCIKVKVSDSDQREYNYSFDERELGLE